MRGPCCVRPAGPDAGFTLVELLVALALLAMAAVLVTQAMASDRAALGRIERRASSGDTVSAAQELIRERLGRLYAATRYDGQSGFTDFDGDASAIGFWADAPTPDLGEQVQKLRLDLDTAGDLALGPAIADGRTVLLKGVKAIEVSYWGPGGAAGTNASWQPQWSRRRPPPQLVRIRLAFIDGDRRVWPELIVRPAVTVNSDCVYDAGVGDCRGQS